MRYPTAPNREGFLRVARWAAPAAVAAILFVVWLRADGAPAGSGERAGQDVGVAGPKFYGINGQFLYPNRVPNPDRHLAAIAASDLPLVRHGGGRWHVTEPAPPRDGVRTYDWRVWDRAVRLSATHGLELYAVLGMGARWASGDIHSADGWRSPPRRKHFGDFADFAAAVASRYGRRGSFWTANPGLPYRPIRNFEVWNEPNWRGTQAFAPKRYAELYRQTHLAIKEVAPRARVVFGSLSFARADTRVGTPAGAVHPKKFLRRAFSHRPPLRRLVRNVSVHLYGGTVERSLSQLAEFRRWIDAYGDPKMKIDITETGVPAWPRHDAVRASYLNRVARAVPRAGCGVRVLLPFTWWTYENDPLDSEHWYGIANRDATLKPSADAYVHSARMVRGLVAGPRRSIEPTRVCAG